MSDRQVLPHRRHGERLSFTIGRIVYQATVNRYPDGRIGEIFLTAGKLGSEADIVMKEAAINASFALQHGVPLNTMRAAMPRNTNGSPEGPMGTLLDLLAGEGGK